MSVFSYDRSNQRESVSESSVSFHDQIIDLYESEKCSDEMLGLKLKLLESLRRLMKEFKFYVIGSSYTGLHTDNSPINIVFTGRKEGDSFHPYFDEILSSYRCSFENVRKATSGQITCSDINFMANATISHSCYLYKVRNSHLIRCYLRLDNRVAPLIFVIKQWRKEKRNKNLSFCLTRFSITLMVIHYLQVGCKPCVLPCLHKMLPDVFKYNSDIDKLDPNMELPEYSSKNTQRVDELLMGFFDYFKKFDFKTQAISVRMGRAFGKELSGHFHSAYYNFPTHPSSCHNICIEDPFNRDNTVLRYESSTGVLDPFANDGARLSAERALSALFEDRKM